MMRVFTLLLPAAALLAAGCSSDNFVSIYRDSVALRCEINDTMMMVVDEDSAKTFMEVHVPKLADRVKLLTDRMDRWAKMIEPDKDRVKEIKGLLDAAVKFRAAGGEMDRGTFGTDLTQPSLFYRMVVDSYSAGKRFQAETARINRVKGKLIAEKVLELESRGLKNPRVGPGLDIDPSVEWPNLNSFKDLDKKLFGDQSKIIL